MKLGDAQIFLIRNITSNAVGLIGSLFFDVFRNLLHAMGLTNTSVPVHLGMFQLVGVAFFGGMLAVSALDFWFYYRPTWKQILGSPVTD